MNATIRAIEYHLPKAIVTNSDLARDFPDWPIDKIEGKTGICERHVAAEDECASDLALEAARMLFRTGQCAPEDIDYILFCTQSPDYFLPTTACLLQHKLGIPTSAGALDFNLGCSGFVYGLGLSKGLIETGQAHNVLLLTGETYSKFIHPRDKSVRTLFGDAGAATLVHGDNNSSLPSIGPFIVGADGRGANNLIVPAGGMRTPRTPRTGEVMNQESGNSRSSDNLYMNGPEIFNFTLETVPRCVEELLARAKREIEDIDLFIFHQANRYMLEHLRKRIGIPEHKFYTSLRNSGNTVSCSIPIALKEALNEGRIKPGDLVMLVGFGVGYSWGATMVRWI